MLIHITAAGCDDDIDTRLDTESVEIVYESNIVPRVGEELILFDRDASEESLDESEKWLHDYYYLDHSLVVRNVEHVLNDREKSIRIFAMMVKDPDLAI